MGHWACSLICGTSCDAADLDLKECRDPTRSEAEERETGVIANLRCVCRLDSAKSGKVPRTTCRSDDQPRMGHEVSICLVPLSQVIDLVCLFLPVADASILFRWLFRSRRPMEPWRHAHAIVHCALSVVTAPAVGRPSATLFKVRPPRPNSPHSFDT